MIERKETDVPARATRDAIALPRPKRRRKWVPDPEATYFYPRIVYDEVVIESKRDGQGEIEYLQTTQTNHQFSAYMAIPSEWATPIKDWKPGNSLFFVVVYRTIEETFGSYHNSADVYSIHGNRDEALEVERTFDFDERYIDPIKKVAIVEVTDVVRDEYL